VPYISPDRRERPGLKTRQAENERSPPCCRCHRAQARPTTASRTPSGGVAHRARLHDTSEEPQRDNKEAPGCLRKNALSASLSANRELATVTAGRQGPPTPPTFVLDARRIQTAGIAQGRLDGSALYCCDAPGPPATNRSRSSELLEDRAGDPRQRAYLTADATASAGVWARVRGAIDGAFARLRAALA